MNYFGINNACCTTNFLSNQDQKPFHLVPNDPEKPNKKKASNSIKTQSHNWVMLKHKIHIKIILAQLIIIYGRQQINTSRICNHKLQAFQLKVL